MKVSVACADFLEHCRISRNLSPHSLRAYAIDLKEFRSFLATRPGGEDVSVRDCDRSTIRGFLTYLFDERKLKETSIKRRMACLKTFFRWLEHEDAVEITPFHRLDLRIRLPKRLPRSLSSNQIRSLLTAPARALGIASHDEPPQDWASRISPGSFRTLSALVAAELLFCTGMRVGELSELTVDRLHLGDGVIHVVGKGDRERVVFVTDPWVRDLLSSYLLVRADRTDSERTRTLLINSYGRKATTGFIRRLIRDVAESAGIERRVTPHMLRHTCATLLLEDGVDIRYVQKLLGHQSIVTTQIYTSVTLNSLRTAIARARTRRNVMRG